MDTATFFPEGRGSAPAAYKEARAICAGCDLRRECLELAIVTERNMTERHGMFGGLTPVERQAFAEGRTRPCETCGAPFVGPGTTCSRECWRENRNRSQRELNARRRAA